MLLLKQTVDSPIDPGTLQLVGPHVDFSASSQFFSKRLSNQIAPRVYLRVETKEGGALELIYKLSKKNEIFLDEQVVHEGDHTFRLRESMQKKEIIEQVQQVSRLAEFVDDPGGKLDPVLFLQRGLLHLVLTLGGELPSPFQVRPYGVDKFADAFRNIIHVPGLRGNPQRTYTTANVAKTFPGRFNDYVASVVHQWIRLRDKRVSKLGEQLRRLNLTWKVGTVQIDETRVDIKVGRLPRGRRGGAQDLVSIADTGFGISQVLPVLVAMLVARSDQIVYLEQPEIHLHPKAQYELGLIIAESVSEEKNVVVETHSDLVLLGMQTAVAEDLLMAEKTILNWFSRDERTGSTRIVARSMTERGGFEDWPNDFLETRLAAQARFLDKS